MNCGSTVNDYTSLLLTRLAADPNKTLTRFPPCLLCATIWADNLPKKKVSVKVWKSPYWFRLLQFDVCGNRSPRETPINHWWRPKWLADSGSGLKYCFKKSKTVSVDPRVSTSYLSFLFYFGWVQILLSSKWCCASYFQTIKWCR